MTYLLRMKEELVKNTAVMLLKTKRSCTDRSANTTHVKMD
jgi:hypothetical protein